MQKDFIKFLKDDNTNDESYEFKYYSLKIHKERYNDRFVVLYSKRISKGLEQNDYDVSGYYDTKDNVLYNCISDLSDLIVDKDSVLESSFGSLFSKIYKEIDDSVEKYIFENAEEFRKYGKTKFAERSDWQKRRDYKDVESIFIQEETPTIKIDAHKAEVKVGYSDFYNNKKIIADYLDNPNEIINKYKELIIKEDKEELGEDLLEYEDKVEHLNQVKENKNGVFDKVYINKNILNSVKNMGVKTLNITINYNNNCLTFKFDYQKFIHDLKSAEYKGYHYDSSYRKVRDFFEQHQIKDNRGCIESDFSFDHITSITFGKNVLYEREISKENKEIENDDFDLER